MSITNSNEVDRLKRTAVLFMAFLLLANGATASEVVSLDRYMEMVREGNHSLRAGVRSVEAAYYGVLASVSYQRPHVSGTVTGSYLSGQKQQDVREKDITAYNVNMGLTHRVDISGVYTLDEQQQVLYYEAQRAYFDGDVNNLLAKAEQNYWSAVLARENIALQKDVLRQRMENNRVTEEKYKQQLVPKLDLIRSEAQVVAAESLVTQAEAQYRDLLATMTALTGGVGVFPIEDPLLVPVFNVSVSLEKARLFRPEVRAARTVLDRSRVVKKLKAKGMNPTLDAGINWVPLSDPWNSSNPQKGEMAATLRLNIPILDGNETKYNVLNTDRLVLAAEASLNSVETSTSMDLSIANNSWEKASALERDKKRQMERSAEELRITELMYNEGMGAQIDLINAQTENQRVRTEYLNAVQGMYLALVELRRVVGDYAPDENGNWKEAVIKYAKGKNIANEMKKEKLQDQKDKSIQKNKSIQKKAVDKKKK